MNKQKRYANRALKLFLWKSDEKPNATKSLTANVMHNKVGKFIAFETNIALHTYVRSIISGSKVGGNAHVHINIIVFEKF